MFKRKRTYQRKNIRDKKYVSNNPRISTDEYLKRIHVRFPSKPVSSIRRELRVNGFSFKRKFVHWEAYNQKGRILKVKRMFHCRN